MMSHQIEQPDPAAVFACALSLWRECMRRSQSGQKVNLSECYNGGDEFMRVIMRAGTQFEKWACAHIEFGQLDNCWPYLLEERFGEACVALKDVTSLDEFCEKDCLSVALRLEAATSLRSTVAKIVEEPASATPNAAAAMPKLVARPKVENADDAGKTRTFKPDGRVVRRNYLEIEARNRSLGRAGEEIILRFERQRLWRAGKKMLAERIEHVAESRGDGLGYDIASFETNGSERLIEVKTTRFGPMTPFYATRREVGVSVARREVYQLYRVFLFSAEPRLFILAGSMRDTCRLDATQFAAIPA